MEIRCAVYNAKTLTVLYTSGNVKAFSNNIKFGKNLFKLEKRINTITKHANHKKIIPKKLLRRLNMYQSIEIVLKMDFII